MDKSLPIKVLLLEGDFSYASYIIDVLSPEKGLGFFELRCANDLNSALEYLRRSVPDILLVDISFPTNHGLQIFDRLQKDFPVVPKLILIDVNDEPLALESVHRGAKDYLLKVRSKHSMPMDIMKVIRQCEEDQTLRKSEELFRTLIENSTDVITILDAEGIVQYESPSLERVFGYKPKELLGQNAFTFIHPEDTAGVLAVFRETIKNLATKSPAVQFRFRHRDGFWLYLEAIGRVIVNDKDQVRCVINSRDVTERVRIESELRSLSLIDELTDLHNRRSFELLAEQEIKKSKRTKTKNIHLIFADVDNLKWINDHFGHLEGDKALIQVAEVLKNTFRSMDIIARLGGDEFVVLITDTLEDNIKKISIRLNENIDAWNRREDKLYQLSISFGITPYDPEHLASVESLLRQADQLMYEQKKLKAGKSA